MVGAPFDREYAPSDEQLWEWTKPLFEEMGVRYRCGICGSTSLHWEVGAMPGLTMGEAMKQLKEEELKQMVTRIWLDLQGTTHDIKEQRRRN